MLEGSAKPTGRCPVCAQSNPPGAKFCNQCGAQMNLVPCAHCGAVNDAKATTCWQCKAAFSGTATECAALEGHIEPMSISDAFAKSTHPRGESMIGRLSPFSQIEGFSNRTPPLSGNVAPLSSSSGSTMPSNSKAPLTVSAIELFTSSSDTRTPLKSKQSLAENNVPRPTVVPFGTSSVVNRVPSRRSLYAVLAFVLAGGFLAYYAAALHISQPPTPPHASDGNANRPAQPLTPAKPPSTPITSLASPPAEHMSGSGGCIEAVAVLGLCNAHAQAQTATPSSTARVRGESRQSAASCGEKVTALGLCITAQ